jgi:tetratricopeptide (TPR) repeat protein
VAHHAVTFLVPARIAFGVSFALVLVALVSLATRAHARCLAPLAIVLQSPGLGSPNSTIIATFGATPEHNTSSATKKTARESAADDATYRVAALRDNDSDQGPIGLLPFLSGASLNYALKGFYFFKRHKWAASIPYLRLAWLHEEHSDILGAYLIRAWLHVGHHERAALLLKEASKQGRVLPELVRLEAYMAYLREDWQRASELYTKLSETSMLDAEGVLRGLESHLRQGYAPKRGFWAVDAGWRLSGAALTRWATLMWEWGHTKQVVNYIGSLKQIRRLEPALLTMYGMGLLVQNEIEKSLRFWRELGHSRSGDLALGQLLGLLMSFENPDLHAFVQSKSQVAFERGRLSDVQEAIYTALNGKKMTAEVKLRQMGQRGFNPANPEEDWLLAILTLGRRRGCHVLQSPHQAGSGAFYIQKGRCYAWQGQSQRALKAFAKAWKEGISPEAMLAEAVDTLATYWQRDKLHQRLGQWLYSMGLKSEKWRRLLHLEMVAAWGTVNHLSEQTMQEWLKHAQDHPQASDVRILLRLGKRDEALRLLGNLPGKSSLRHTLSKAGSLVAWLAGDKQLPAWIVREGWRSVLGFPGAETFGFLGWTMFDEGDFDKAKVWFERALLLNPDDVWLEVGLGDALKALNKSVAAKKAYKSALNRRPLPVIEGMINERLHRLQNPSRE